MTDLGLFMPDGGVLSVLSPQSVFSHFSLVEPLCRQEFPYSVHEGVAACSR